MSKLKNIFRKFVSKLKKAKIFAMHYVQMDNNELCPCILSTDNFYKVIDENKKYISLDTLLSSSAKKYDGGVVITIDDGLFDLYTIAYPYLTNKGIPFTAYISADLIDKDGYVTAEQVVEMSKNPLVTIASHGCTHKCLDELTIKEQEYEIFSSKQKLEELIGRPVEHYSYSNGRFTKDTIKLVKKAGYKSAVGVIPRVYNRLTKKRYDLPRFNITDKTV